MGKVRQQPPVKAAVSRSDLRDQSSYLYLSSKPLHILVFLLPLVVLYEIGSAVYLMNPSTGTLDQIRAARLLNEFFRLFGIGAVYLPGVLLVVVLFLWHLLNRDRWKVKGRVLGWMAIESIGWTLPLVVAGHLLSYPAEAAAVLASAPARALSELSPASRITVALGAGLYEELLFRMMLIAMIHLVAVDLIRLKDGVGRVVAVAVSAFAFAMYHDVMLGAGGVNWAQFVYYIVAGLYFGALYVIRGFGIVVAVHAFYDLIVLLLLPAAG